MLSLSDCKVIAIAPHIDDVELGAGATIHHLTKSKSNKVYYVGLSLPPLVDSNTFHEEFSESTQILGLDPERIILRNFNPRNLFDARSEILQLFYDLNKELKPDLVIIPNSQDIHQSHEVVFDEARLTCRHQLFQADVNNPSACSSTRAVDQGRYVAC